MNNFSPTPASVALVYDRVNSNGGAEKVLQALHSIYPDAPLYTSVADISRASWAKNWKIITSQAQNFPFLRNNHRLLGWLMPFLFESFDLTQYDVVISVTSEAAKAVITQPHQLHVCYLLTPTRYLWSHQEKYLEQVPVVFRWFAKKVIGWLQKWDWVAARRPDFIIPISKAVKGRAEQYYQRKIEEPLYPTLVLLHQAVKPDTVPRGPYVFTWGRHVAYKRFDIVISACVAQRQSLVIAGTGPQTRRLQRQAKKLDPQGKYITFVGAVSDSHLAWYLQNAMGAIFPQEEDFGITFLEANAYGCPIIVHQGSGAAELLDSSMAVFISEESINSVKKAITQLERKTWKRLDIQRQARQYAGVRFSRQWSAKLDRLWAEYPKLLDQPERIL